MTHWVTLVILVVGVSIMTGCVSVHDAPSTKNPTVKEVKELSEAEQVALALSAAPAHISKDAGVITSYSIHYTKLYDIRENE